MINVLPIFSDLNQEYLNLLNNLKPNDWNKSTVCKEWDVRDITVHLLDTNIRRLSIGRDGHSFLKNKQFSTYEELLAFLNNLNEDWIKATKRVSNDIIIELTTIYQQQLLQHFNSLDPFDMALFPVRWAGKEHSENWFDIAREYTERWLHQQQIRFALNDQTLLQKKYYSLYLETAMQALPYTYLKVKAPLNTIVKVEIVGEAGGFWTIKKEKSFWRFTQEQVDSPDALIYIDQQIAWLLFSKGINTLEAAQYYQIHGDVDLASYALKMTAVMA
jgi:hypothetical protein